MRRRRTLERLADEDLMGLVADRDPVAFELFYDRHSRAAYSLAYRIVGDAAVAEDVTQEAFLSAWRSEAGYDQSKGSVRNWALGIVRNRAIDAIRRRSSAAPVSSEHELEAMLDRPSAEFTDEQVLARESTAELQGLLGQIPGDQSQVIELAYFGGFSQSEIAESLALPLGTVKGRMRLGLEKIRTTLEAGNP